MDEENSKVGFLSTGGKINGVLKAEEKRGRSYLAAGEPLAQSAFVKDPICTVQYLLLGHNTFSWRFVLYPHLTLVYNTIQAQVV